MDRWHLSLKNVMKLFISVAVSDWLVFRSAFGKTLSSDSSDSSHVQEPARCVQGSCWYLGPYFQFVPQCVDGNCQCYAPNYNKITCLPCVGSCNIRKYEGDFSSVHAKPSPSGILYSCVGKAGRHANVHVLGVDGVDGQRRTRPPTAAEMNVSITSSSGSSKRPIILVLTNNEPVNWILNFQPYLDIRKVILISHYPDHSSVSTVSGVSQSYTVEKWPRSTPTGFGSDFGGGNTAELLAILTGKFGDIASFAGTYEAESWELYLPSVCYEILPEVAAATTQSTPAMTGPTKPTPSDEVEPISCLDSSCWHVGSSLRFNASCVNGVCECNAQYYNKFSCLPSVGSCRIRSLVRDSADLHARPSLYPILPYTVYSCLGERSSNDADVHVIAVHEGSTKTHPPSASRVYLSILPPTTGSRPIVLVLANHEPVEWRLETHPPNLNIVKVISISPYPDLSSVATDAGGSHALVVEKRPSDTLGGYGTDRTGGNTAGMLVDLTEEFGGVTSFAGTYKANYWYFNLTAIDDFLPLAP